MENRFCNPFRVIAGGKALAWGLLFIVSAVALLYAGGCVQDGYIHIGLRPAGVGLWQTAAMQLLLWLIPAVVLYGCGAVMSHSKIRLIDMLGTTAFAQLILLPMIAPMLCFDMTQQPFAPAWVVALLGVWELAWLIVFFLWNYAAFSVSCNVRGVKAAVVFSVVQVLFVLFSGVLGRAIL